MCPNDLVLIGNRFMSKLDIIRFQWYKDRGEIGMFFGDGSDEYFHTCPKSYTFDECIKDYIEN